VVLGLQIVTSLKISVPSLLVAKHGISLRDSSEGFGGIGIIGDIGVVFPAQLHVPVQHVRLNPTTKNIPRSTFAALRSVGITHNRLED
jgi:hypothetical protein